MGRRVSVSTGARLHFGPLSFRPKQGRHFGGVGVMIDRPACSIEFEESDRDEVVGDECSSRRAWSFLLRYRESCPPEHQPPPCRVVLKSMIPAHHGLGSGTQSGLAIARGLSSLAGEQLVDLQELARRAGRGQRSAVGIHGFRAGGLIVDAGLRTDDDIGELAVRLPLPDTWRVLLIVPGESSAGLSGLGEESAFDRLRSMPLSTTHRMSHIVLSELLPAVQASNFDDFSAAVFEYGRLAGEFFAPIQQGVYGHPGFDRLIDWLRDRHVLGVGQTSWGPTAFAFVPHEAAGQEVTEALSRSSLGHCSVQLAAPLNRGHVLIGA